MLMLAWKRFWMVVVPYEKRGRPDGHGVWLDFATFVVPCYQRSHATDGTDCACLATGHHRSPFIP